MATKPTPRAPRKSGGYPLWNLLVILLGLAGLCVAVLGVLVYVANSKTAKLERALKDVGAQQQQREIDQQHGVEIAKLAIARNHQDAVLAQARSATNALTGLLSAARQLATDASALKTNEPGRQVALHPDLVAQARHLYDVELPALAAIAELTTRLEGVRRIQQAVQENLGKAYEPEAEFMVTAQNTALWAEPEQRKVAQAQLAIASLVREGVVKVTSDTVTADSPTLAAAIRKLTDAEASERQRILTAQTGAANTNAMVIEAQAQARRILEEALVQSNKVFVALQAQQQEQARQDALQKGSNQVAQAATDAALKASEDHIRQIQLDAIATSNRMQLDFQARLDAQQRLDDQRKASNNIDIAKSRVAVLTAEEEARKVVLRNKASDSAVQNKLAPFIQKGLWQIKGYSTEPKPLSFNALNSFRALEDSQGGMNAMYHIVTCVDDKMRPRWKLAGGVLAWRKFPESVARIKEAQNLLIELGAVLVEMGKLQP